MSFADEYLAKQDIYKGWINTPPDSELGISIVIPCYNEPDIIKALGSLYCCDTIQTKFEIIVVINTAVNTHEKIKDQNRRSLKEIDDWKILNPEISVHVIYLEDIPEKKAGVGFARKIGMDEAVFRYNSLENPNGVILSFDADCTCDSNYLTEIEEQFCNNNKLNSCVVYFEHPITGNEFSADVYKAIVQYELYLRYYLQAVRYTGYPYAYHTVGSCFGVKAGVYVKQGGMNKRQAGEDFYFLQKVFPLEGVIEINTTKIIPSPRPSDRVPFGTGPVINQLLKSGNNYMTYDFEVFKNVKELFGLLPDIYDSDRNIRDIRNVLTGDLNDFLDKICFNEIVNESKENSSSYKIFVKRFYNRFNAFQILKYLNYTHEKKYNYKKVGDVTKELLMHLNIMSTGKSLPDDLLLMRSMEK